MSDIKEKIIDALKEVYDPEIPINVYDLGLIYDIDVKDDNTVFISMTLTSPTCPAGEYLRQLVEDNVNSIEEVSNVVVELTFEPLWIPERVNPQVKEELGLFGDEDINSKKDEIKFEKVCVSCGRKDSEIPVIETYYKGEKTNLCIKCLKNFD